MNNEEQILTLLEQINTRMGNLEAGQTALEGRMGGLEDRIGTLEAGQAQMQEDITSINLRLELDVGKRFDAVNEGIDTILKKLETLDEVKELAEETRDRVDAIHAAVVQHSATITELKQAK